MKIAKSAIEKITDNLIKAKKESYRIDPLTDEELKAVIRDLKNQILQLQEKINELVRVANTK